MAQRLSRMELSTFQTSVRIVHCFLLIPPPFVKSFTSPTVFFAKPPVACVLPRHLSSQTTPRRPTHTNGRRTSRRKIGGVRRAKIVCVAGGGGAQSRLACLAERDIRLARSRPPHKHTHSFRQPPKKPLFTKPPPHTTTRVS